MAYPLTLYVELEDSDSARAAAQQIALGFTEDGMAALHASRLVHFARFAVVPRFDGQPHALLLITTFDGDWDHYVKFFFERLKPAFTALGQVARDKPRLPLEQEDFSRWVRAHNLTPYETRAPNEALPGNEPRWPFYEAHTHSVEQLLREMP